MAGPLSTPNGDVRIIRGHVHEEFMCICGNIKCGGIRLDSWDDPKKGHKMIPLREYLLARGRLSTGKTGK